MCMICVELEREKMTSSEAYRAIGEYLKSHEDLDDEFIRHLNELVTKLEEEK